jgi:hypothetical protein
MAVADEATPSRIRRYAMSSDEYLAFCGAVGLGRLLSEGEEDAVPRLHTLAGDSRWRVREGVAMGLQRLGDDDPSRLLAICQDWLVDSPWLVMRAVIAALCEPRLLEGKVPVDDLLGILDEVTGRLASAGPDQRRDKGFRVLRQALGYCWSVAVAAHPDPGFARFDRWAAVDDPDVRWMARENLRKARLRRADPVRWARLVEDVNS